MFYFVKADHQSARKDGAILNSYMTKPVKRFFSKFDVNRDGTLTPDELQEAKELLALELQEQKADTQRRMAWAAMAAMIVFTVALFSPWVPETRVAAIGGVSDTFYIGCASIVGAFMGFTTWMANNRSESLYGGSGGYSEGYGKYGRTDL